MRKIPIQFSFLITMRSQLDHCMDMKDYQIKSMYNKMRKEKTSYENVLEFVKEIHLRFVPLRFKLS